MGLSSVLKWYARNLRDNPYANKLLSIRNVVITTTAQIAAVVLLSIGVEKTCLTHVAAKTADSSDAGNAVEEDSPEVIVSLTSFPGRIARVHLVVESLLRQTCPPDRIILVLARTQFEPSDVDSIDDAGGAGALDYLRLRMLPRKLSRLTLRGLNIVWCDDDLGPHKKYVFVRESFPEAIIIAADDDVIYPPTMVAELTDAFRANPACIHCRRARVIALDDAGRLRPYAEWPIAREANREPDCGLLAINGSGVLYPPRSIPVEALEVKRFLLLAPYADDLWLHAMTVRSGFPVQTTSSVPGPCLPAPGTQHVALWKRNVDAGGNDLVLRALISNGLGFPGKSIPQDSRRPD